MNKVKPTDFAKALAKYLLEYLPETRGLSDNTVKSYSDSMSLFLDFYETELHINRDKLNVKDITCETVEQFYLWLEKSKGCSTATRNQRRIAVNAFLKYLQYQNPGYVSLCQQIRSIPQKPDKRQTVHHIPVEAIEAIFKMPNLKSKDGRRDFALLSILYETAARVSEIAELCIGDVRFHKEGATVTLSGKSKYPREVPIDPNVSNFLKGYLSDEVRYRPCAKANPFFCNRTQGNLTRAGVTYILKKYANEARISFPELIIKRVSPHIFRHSRAMHWLEAGVELQYIKDLLGHVDISTTEIYARINVEMKRRLLEAAGPTIIHEVRYPSWTEDKNLVNWLNSFKP